MIPVEDRAEIRVLNRRDKVSRRGIARRLGISRATVDRAVASDGTPRYARLRWKRCSQRWSRHPLRQPQLRHF